MKIQITARTRIWQVRPWVVSGTLREPDFCGARAHGAAGTESLRPSWDERRAFGITASILKI